jgi:CheY-like chemotaxis protein/HPt (histidine-containing phosphotransfer) domain-containing protein/anti-sigma regulatory factor (Ser/Thr protein kinase)
MSKIEAGKISLSPVDYDFDYLVSNIGSMFRFLAHKKNLDFQYEKRGELPVCLYGDDIKLRQVLMNICANAVNYTSAGFVRFTVSSNGGSLVFSVKDSGPGIKEGDLETLFDPFARLELSKNRNIKGSGLGLAISKSFVDMMGGTISVESSYGEGSVFTVTIPEVIGNPDNIAQRTGAEKKITFAAPGAKILVVDDNSLNLRVAQGLLGLYGIRADMVSSGMEGVNAVQKDDYDIVFMDHMMPEMDGVEAAAKIRSFGGKFNELVIVALTANAAEGAREMFLSNGFNDFLTKPVELEKLSEILKKWIPEEKRGKAGVSLPLITEEKSDFLDAVSKISCIDTKGGVNSVFNSVHDYRETLELFWGALDSDCSKMESFLRDEDIGNFAISVHGMKTSLATVGAAALSQRALELELAAKERDLEFCLERGPMFFESLRALYKELSGVFALNDTKEDKLPAGDGVFFHEGLWSALEAAHNFDDNSGVRILDKLLMYDYGKETNSMLKKARRAFREFDFDAASDCLNKIEDFQTTDPRD